MEQETSQQMLKQKHTSPEFGIDAHENGGKVAPTLTAHRATKFKLYIPI